MIPYFDTYTMLTFPFSLINCGEGDAQMCLGNSPVLSY